MIKVRSAVTGSCLTADKKKISQKYRVKQDPDDISGLQGVIEIKGLRKTASTFSQKVLT